MKVPRMLAIQSKRLAALHKLLQALIIILVLYYCVETGIWKEDCPMEPWSTAILSGSANRSAGINSTVGHCATLPEAVPRVCRPLSQDEAFVFVKNGVFIPTVISESSSWDGSGEACRMNATQQWCQDSVPAGAFKSDIAGRCSCQGTDRFYVLDPLQERLKIFHGYRARLSSGTSVLGGSAMTADVHFAGRYLYQESGELLTIFQSLGGSRCLVGGRSTWTRTDASNGISATLEELLICAGLSLEMSPDMLAKGAFTYQSGITLRDMGLSLELQFAYSSTGFLSQRPQVCHVTVTALPNFISHHSRGTRLDGAMRWTREANGVVLTTVLHSTYQRFHLPTLVNSLVNLFVIMQIPLTIVQLLALYCLGSVSKIYRNARQTNLNIFTQLHSFIAKHLLAVVGFRGLVGVWNGSVSSMPKLSKEALLDQLEDVFAEECNNDILHCTDIMRMVNVVFQHMDTDGSGEIGFREFVQACNGQESHELATLAHFFRPQKKKNLGRLFDSTHQKINSDGAFGNRISRHSTEELQDKPMLDSSEVGVAQQEPQLQEAVSELDRRVADLEEQNLALAADLHKKLAALKVEISAMIAEITCTSLDAKAGSLDDQHVSPAETLESCSVPHVSEKSILLLQQRVSYLEEQNTEAWKAIKQEMEMGMGHTRSFEQHAALTTELSQTICDLGPVVAELSQNTGDLDPVVAMMQGDLVTLRTKIASLHDKSQVFADRLVLLEVDMSALARCISDFSTCEQQQQPPRHAELQVLVETETLTTLEDEPVCVCGHSLMHL